MYAKLNPLRLGIAAGIVWGVFLFILSWISMYTGYGMYWLSQWMDIYPGFSLSPGGTFFGLLFGFIEGFLAFFLVSWLYNFLKPSKSES